MDMQIPCRGNRREAAIRCDSDVPIPIRFPFLYFALALSHKFSQFLRSEARTMAENFRFFLFSEIQDRNELDIPQLGNLAISGFNLLSHHIAATVLLPLLVLILYTF